MLIIIHLGVFIHTHCVLYSLVSMLYHLLFVNMPSHVTLFPWQPRLWILTTLHYRLVKVGGVQEKSLNLAQDIYKATLKSTTYLDQQNYTLYEINMHAIAE